MGKDLRAIRERVDDTNVRVSNVREEIEALRTLDSRARRRRARCRADRSERSECAAGAGHAGAAAGRAAVDRRPVADAHVRHGARRLRRRPVVARRHRLRAFLKTFPRSEMADDAQFYHRRNVLRAESTGPTRLPHTMQVIQNYPMGNAVPDAYYKRGLAQERLGQTRRRARHRGTRW